MAEQKILEAFESFDALYPSILPGEITKMNGLITILHAVIPLLNEVGGKDPRKGNGLAEDYNYRMAMIDNLSRRKPPSPDGDVWISPRQGKGQTQAPATTAAPAPARPTLTANQEIASSSSPSPQARPVLNLSAQEPVPAPRPRLLGDEEEPVEVVIPGEMWTAMKDLDSLIDRANAITQMDVWTGKSNAIVDEWNRWQAKYAQNFVDLVLKFGRFSPELREHKDKYNNFPDLLGGKIRRLQITDQQKQTVEAFMRDYQGVIDTFKAKPIRENFNRMVQLDQGLHDLQIPHHPAVASALETSKSAIAQMEDILRQLGR